MASHATIVLSTIPQLPKDFLLDRNDIVVQPQEPTTAKEALVRPCVLILKNASKCIHIMCREEEKLCHKNAENNSGNLLIRQCTLECHESFQLLRKLLILCYFF